MSTRWWRLWALITRVGVRRADERTLNDEIESYLEHDIDAHVAAGMTPDDARRSALVDLGGREQVKESVRGSRAGAWADNLRQDLRYASRTLIKAPGFSLTVIGSLCVGITAYVAAFTLINAVFFKPLPGIRSEHELVSLRRSEACARAGAGCWFPRSYGDYLELRASVTTLDLASLTTGSVSVALPRAAVVRAAYVTDNYFKVLGARPHPGRDFDGSGLGHAAVVISHALWTREFSGDVSAVGRLVRIADFDARIVGVAPPSFIGLGVGLFHNPTDIWLPMSAAALTRGDETARPGADGPDSVGMIGRLTPGVDASHARPQLETVITRMAAERGQRTPASMVDLADVRGNTPARVAFATSIVMPIPTLVFALACVNAASVLVARASRRTREISLRLAIGASRGRIVRQLLTESLLLSIVASLAALALVWVVLPVASRALELPIGLDRSVIAVTLLTAAVSVVAFGLAPAAQLSRQPARALGSAQGSGGDTPGWSRARSAMVVTQVALSLGLLGTGMQVVSIVESQFKQAGTDPDRLVLASFDLQQLRWPSSDVDVFYRRLLDGALKMPHAASAGLGPFLWTPGRFGSGRSREVSVAGWRFVDGPKDGQWYFGGHVSKDVFDAVGLRIVEGRGFEAEDESAAGPPVAVVNRPFASSLDGRAIGQIVRVGTTRTPYDAATDLRIVGVVEAAVDPGYSRTGEGAPAIYVSSPLAPQTSRVLYVRSQGAAADTVAAVRALVQQIDPRVPIQELGTLQQINERLSPQVWFARLAAALGAVALALSTVGLYGVIGYIVSLRSREFAVRLSLGATPAGVLLLVLRRTFALTAVGLVLGALVGSTIGPFVQEEGMSGFDLNAFARPLALSLVSILLASAAPAIRAARVDPIVVLRSE